MARNWRLNVGLDTTTRNSSKIHWQRFDDPPPHDAVNRRDRAALDDRDEGGSMRVVQPGRLPRRLAINQPVWPVHFELDHPVANDLKRHPANLRRLGACRAFVNRRQRQ